MSEQIFSARRCRGTRKPLASQCPEIQFYRCPECKTLFQITGSRAMEPQEITCCRHRIQGLEAVPSEAVADRIRLSYQITGGYNDNAVRVSWKSVIPGCIPEWIYLKTFTGGYLQYVMAAKQSPLVFALADTDAFAYCDEDPCLECVFRCKRGFIIYVYSEVTGLVEIPLDKMTAHWQSGAK